jgi:hypothetical protein
MDYKEDIKIDEHHLDKEWKKQSQNFMEISEASANADAAARRKKEDVEIVRAECYLEIKKKLEEEGEKTTENAIDARIKVHPKYNEAVSSYLECAHEAQIIKGAVMAFDQKKSGLENLVKLKLAGYYSEPKDSSKEAEESEQSRKNQKEKLKNRRK